MKKAPNKNKNQTGRTMTEMLGVLAIVGILSVGAFAGYSSAMTTYRANQAIDEIKHIIHGIIDLFADKNNYQGLDQQLLKDAEIFNTNNFGSVRNVFNLGMNAYPYNVGNSKVFRLDYRIYDNSDISAICEKILLAGWQAELGNNLVGIHIWYAPGSANFYPPSVGTGDYPIPIKISDAQIACKNAQTLIFLIR
ncbi:MAG: hypothetical protein GY804_06210 [Alphaproteobacteria bacterium]|nr:hypothetical protein [Alphaproteobacteria bacterium]